MAMTAMTTERTIGAVQREATTLDGMRNGEPLRISLVVRATKLPIRLAVHAEEALQAHSRLLGSRVLKLEAA